MAFIAKTLFPASGYVVDNGDYVPTAVIGQAAFTLQSAGYVVEVPDDPEKDDQFYEERGTENMPSDHSDPREIIPGVVPLPYETHSNLEVTPEEVEAEENTEGRRVLDPSSAAAGGHVGLDQGAVVPDEMLAEGEESGDSDDEDSDEEDEADREVAEANKNANATEGAKQLANREGVLLSDVDGTGDNGRVQKSDVEQYLEED